MLILAMGSSQSQAQRPGDPVVDERSISLEDLQQKALPGISRSGNTTIKEYGEEWWAIEVEFTTLPELVEEVTVLVFLEGYDNLGRDKDPMNNPVTLTSEITFINLLKGQHVASFYLHPGAAVRYSGKKARDFRKYTYRVEIRAAGKLEFEGDSNKDLGEGWHREGQQIEGVLLPVHESPWWPAEANRYDQIQPKRR